jgi:hypothetical protein
MDTVHHQGWLADAPQIRKALSGDLLPFTKRGNLGHGHSGPGDRFTIVFPLQKPSYKRLALGLA